MRYANNFHIIEYPLEFQNTRKRLKRRNIGFNFPIIISTQESTFDNIVDANTRFCDQGYSGLPMHFHIDRLGNVYKCRDTAYQNGYAEHPYISLGDIAKNSILVDLEFTNSDRQNFAKSIQRESLVKLLSYICLTERLLPAEDIYDLGEFFCREVSAKIPDIDDIKNEVMLSLFPNYKRNFETLLNNDYTLVLMPNEKNSKRTISYISKVLAMSHDFDEWFPVASQIRRANQELLSVLKEQNPSLYTEDELLFAPVDPMTLIVCPPSKFNYYKKSIISAERGEAGYEYIVNTYAEAVKDISKEILKNIE